MQERGRGCRGNDACRKVRRAISEHRGYAVKEQRGVNVRLGVRSNKTARKSRGQKGTVAVPCATLQNLPSTRTQVQISNTRIKS